VSEFSTKINQITYEERVHDMIGELSCHDHEKIVRHHLGVCYELYENLEAKIARLESRGIEDMKDRIKTLEAAITLADGQYMGCGGNLKPSEIVEAMRNILGTALGDD